MLTDAQHQRLPGILREIVEHDRQSAAIRDELSRCRVIGLETGKVLRHRNVTRSELREGARGLYGRSPLRGDTGPGRPTAASA